MNNRRLAFHAARHDLKQARVVEVERRSAMKIARADFAHLTAERAAGRATVEQVANARRVLRDKERDARAAAAEVRARRVRLGAARAAIPTASEPGPLERLQAEHAAVTAKWMLYETDPARLITYPAMSDIKQPATAAYFTAAERAQELRQSVGERATPAEFAAYRDAVTHLERAFDAAEYNARVQAGEVPPALGWQDAAHDVLSRSAAALDKAAGAAASALSAWTNRDRPDRR